MLRSHTFKVAHLTGRLLHEARFAETEASSEAKDDGPLAHLAHFQKVPDLSHEELHLKNKGNKWSSPFLLFPSVSICVFTFFSCFSCFQGTDAVVR